MSPVIVLLPVAVVSALACGVLGALVASIQRPLAQRLTGLDPRGNALPASFGLGLLLGSLLGGLAVDHLGVETTLIASALLAAIGLSLLAVREHLPTSLLTLLVIGVTTGGLVTATTILFTAAFPTAPAAAAIGLGWTLIGLTSLLTPWLLEKLTNQLRLRRSLLLLALVSLLPALAAALTPADAFPPCPDGELLVLVRTPALWLCGMIFFFYAATEATLNTWAGEHLTQLGIAERRVRLLQAGFWLSLLGSRLLVALLLFADHLPPPRVLPWVLMGLGALLATALGNLASTAYRGSASFGLLLLGACCGPLFPLLVGLLFGHTPDQRGTAFGALYALGALGTLLLLPAVNIVAARRGAHRALRLPLIFMLLLLGLALVLGLTA